MANAPLAKQGLNTVPSFIRNSYRSDTKRSADQIFFQQKLSLELILEFRIWNRRNFPWCMITQKLTGWSVIETKLAKFSRSLPNTDAIFQSALHVQIHTFILTNNWHLWKNVWNICCCISVVELVEFYFKQQF